jgi:hypothetical protein
MLICVNFAWLIEVIVYLKPLRHAMFRDMQMIVWSKPLRSMGLLDECLIWAELIPKRPPWHGSSPALFVCGGAQRGISLAKVDFVGESTQIHLMIRSGYKYIIISNLYVYHFGLLDFLWNPANPLGQIYLTKSSLPNLRTTTALETAL